MSSFRPKSMKPFPFPARRLLLLFVAVTSFDVRWAAELTRGILVEDVHIEYHPSSSLGTSGRSFPGSYVADWSGDWSMPTGTIGGRLSVARCVDIPANMSLCRTIGYQQMRIPNLLDHDSVTEATQQATNWVPLLNIRCHSDTQMFLCSLFAPICLDRPIFPCRTLCQAVRSGCETRMLKYGFPWPEMLDCDKFPLDNDLCIGVQTDSKKPAEVVCPACNQPDTVENIMDNFCSADFVMRIRVDAASSISLSSADVRLIVSKKKIYKKGSLKPRELRRSAALYLENAAAQCQCNAIDRMGFQPQQPGEIPINSAVQSTDVISVTSTGNYLVMGNRRADRLVISFIQPLERHSRLQSKVLSAMKIDRICKHVSVSPYNPLPVETSKSASRKQAPVSPTANKKTQALAALPAAGNEKKRVALTSGVKNIDNRNKNRSAKGKQSTSAAGRVQQQQPSATAKLAPRNDRKPHSKESTVNGLQSKTIR